jgi:hypothetical protein
METSFEVTELTLEQSVDALVGVCPSQHSWFAGEWIRERVNHQCGFNIDDRFAAREYLASQYGYL